jgi:hypothetical protein
MSLDNAKNFAKATVSAGHDAVAVLINLVAGQGQRMPTAPFNVVWWNATDYPDPSDDPNVEVCRVTEQNGDQLTLVRAQEGTTATPKNINGKTYRLIAGMTAKVINEDLQTQYPVTINRQAGKITSIAGPKKTITLAREAGKITELSNGQVTRTIVRESGKITSIT